MSSSTASAMDSPEQAHDWLVRMKAPGCTHAERVACARWRAQSPAHEAAYQQAQAVWRHSPLLAADPAMAAALRAADAVRPARPPATRRWMPPLALAAVLAVAAIVAAWRWLPLSSPAERYQTVLGEQRHLVLPDGTGVVLDTNTTMAVHYSRKQRLVELETGQALFRVERDPGRPFQVRAAGGAVTAVGTQFMVRLAADSAGAAVTLLEGKVVVDSPPAADQRRARTTLQPGQQLRFDGNGQWSATYVDAKVARGWSEGTLVAHNWTLGALTTEMNRYLARPLRLDDPTLAELRISGTFRTGDVPALTKVLEHGWPVQITQTQDAVVLSRKPLP